MSGIYIHIPFCRQICHYCDFHHSASLAAKDEMLQAISRELTDRQREIIIGSVRTLYFGGGTPSVCSPQEIGRLVEQVKALWEVNDFEEVTLEANPDDLTPEYLNALRASGVDRLSMGIQSFQDEHLRQMNRRHTAQGAVEAVRNAQQAGFGNITVDLIYGLPGMTREEWEDNLRQVVALGVQQNSAYHLTIEPQTVFGKRGLQPIEESESHWQFARLREVLEEAGFEHYEVSNFARPGCRAKHNSAYWTGEPYLGAGPSAHAYDGKHRRSWNVSHNKRYLEGIPPEIELLTPDDLHNEYLMTRLRTSDGIDMEEFRMRFGGQQAEKLLQKLTPYLTVGQMISTDTGVAIKPEHFLVSDYLICALFR